MSTFSISFYDPAISYEFSLFNSSFFFSNKRKARKKPSMDVVSSTPNKMLIDFLLDPPHPLLFPPLLLTLLLFLLFSSNFLVKHFFVFFSSSPLLPRFSPLYRTSSLPLFPSNFWLSIFSVSFELCEVQLKLEVGSILIRAWESPLPPLPNRFRQSI